MLPNTLAVQPRRSLAPGGGGDERHILHSAWLRHLVTELGKIDPNQPRRNAVVLRVISVRKILNDLALFTFADVIEVLGDKDVDQTLDFAKPPYQTVSTRR